MSVLNETRDKVEPSDVPGVVEAMDGEGMVLESIGVRADRLLERAMDACGDKALVTPAIHQLLGLYRAFADKVATHPDAATVKPPAGSWWRRLLKR